MRKNDFLITTAILISLTVAVLLHLSLNEKPGTRDKRESEIKKEDIEEKDNTEIRTRVALKIIKEIKKAKKPKPTPKRSKQPKLSAVKVESVLKGGITASPHLLENGSKMIGNKGEHLGSFPSVIAEYRKTLGFSNYMYSINRIGGRFFIMDLLGKRLKAELDIKTGGLKSIENLSNLSPRSRDISNESAVEGLISLARKRYGPSSYSIVLLLPLKLDALLVAGMENALMSVGKSNKDFSCFRGRYEKNSKQLILRIISGRLKSGKNLGLDISFNLNQL